MKNIQIIYFSLMIKKEI